MSASKIDPATGKPLASAPQPEAESGFDAYGAQIEQARPALEDWLKAHPTPPDPDRRPMQAVAAELAKRLAVLIHASDNGGPALKQEDHARLSASVELLVRYSDLPELSEEVAASLVDFAFVAGALHARSVSETDVTARQRQRRGRKSTARRTNALKRKLRDRYAEIWREQRAQSPDLGKRQIRDMVRRGFEKGTGATRTDKTYDGWERQEQLS